MILKLAPFIIAIGVIVLTKATLERSWKHAGWFVTALGIAALASALVRFAGWAMDAPFGALAFLGFLAGLSSFILIVVLLCGIVGVTLGKADSL